MSSKQNCTTGEQCVICDEEKINGIHLYTRFICRDCEQNIIATDTKDEQYRFYLSRLKKVLQPEQYS